MDRGNLINALPLVAAVVNALRSAGRFQRPIGVGRPRCPPNLHISFIVPVGRIIRILFMAQLLPLFCPSVNRLFCVLWDQPNTSHLHSAGDAPSGAIIIYPMRLSSKEQKNLQKNKPYKGFSRFRTDLSLVGLTYTLYVLFLIMIMPHGHPFCYAAD